MLVDHQQQAHIAKLQFLAVGQNAVKAPVNNVEAEYAYYTGQSPGAKEAPVSKQQTQMPRRNSSRIGKAASGMPASSSQKSLHKTLKGKKEPEGVKPVHGYKKKRHSHQLSQNRILADLEQLAIQNKKAMEEFQAAKREMSNQITDMRKQYAKAIQPLQKASNASRKGLFQQTHCRERSLKNLEDGIENLKKIKER